MTRYKGRTSFAAIEKTFPHIVEMAVPEGGLGKQLDAMYGWHRARGIRAMHGRGRREKGRDYIRWCFTDPALAAAFDKEFGACRHSGEGAIATHDLVCSGRHGNTRVENEKQVGSPKSK